MPVWEAILLGVIQGLTEFLPISSTAHLLVVRKLLGHPHPEDALTIVIQIGTLVAVVGYFRPDFVRIMHGLWADVRSQRLASTADSRLGWLIVLGTVPAVTAGYFLKNWLKTTFFHATAIAVVAIVFALLMAAAEQVATRRARRGLCGRGEEQISCLDALWVGIWQALALMPGGSRSGTTITGGLFAGLTRPAAAKFSFLLSLPVMLGAGIKELYDEYQKLDAPVAGEPASLFASGDQITALVVGTVTATIVGYGAIAFLLGFLKHYSMRVFVVYRLLLGVAILLMLAAGLL